MSNYNIENLARNMGFNDNYINKLNAANQFISESANKDRDILNSQLNQTLADYERERQKQNNEFIKEGQAAYVDYAKAINPYSSQNSNSNRIGLGNSGYAESSLIGANNTYQNRYTNTKTNYDNIFANINNNICAVVFFTKNTATRTCIRKERVELKPITFSYIISFLFCISSFFTISSKAFSAFSL